MAEHFPDILPDIWREACRHLRASESADTIARLLSAHLPLAALIFREFHVEQSLVETVATGHVGGDSILVEARTELPARTLRRAVAWCRQREIGRRTRRGESRHHWVPLAPVSDEDDVLVAPLNFDGRPLGVAILVARRHARFDARCERLVAALIEPFSTAMQNDHRLRELATLREAAEADKQTLLARLGREDLDDAIVGAEAGLRPVMQRVTLVARSSAPVIILGETGTGKEVIARTIHNGSPRTGAPFLRVNCGAIPTELIDSQLFGHEKGSFTGATDQRKGWFERADGGTLFLDEIGELPLAAQVRLLRILQDGQLERVGGQESIRVDVRIIAATHRDLAAMVREGRFREDLWYRVSVFPVLLPPLRERAQDIPALSRHFARRAATRFGLTPCEPSDHDVALLSSYRWPGNVRELASVIDRAAILGEGRSLEIAKALGAPEPGPPARPHAAPPALEGVSIGPGIATLDNAMRDHIIKALRLTHGRIEGRHGAARLLAINPHTLRSRMRKLKIDWGAIRREDAE